MPKEFFTEKDIEDMVKRGVMRLDLTEDTVLTELAYEKAKTLGMKLVRSGADTPPAAPVRPYISQNNVTAPKPATPLTQAGPVLSSGYPPMPAPPMRQESSQPYSAPSPMDLQQRIRTAVLARLGSQVDTKLLDVIIQRVLSSIGPNMGGK